MKQQAIAEILPIAQLQPAPNFMLGGQWLVDAIKKYGVNERGDKLRITPAYLEVARLIGDFRVASVYTSGAAQVFKTNVHWQLACALITIGRHDFAWTYPQKNIIGKLVPSQFKPIVSKWEAALGVAKKASQSDSKSMEIHQSVCGTARFGSANDSSAASKARDGTATANTNQVAYSSDVAFYDERSQFPARQVDSIRRRFLQSRIITRPERLTGTPGNGGGIELEISLAKYQFEAHIFCGSCGKLHSLSPLGCLLKPVVTNVEKNTSSYFDSAGRPLDWHYHDSNDKKNSAYFGCPYCSYEITKADRLASHFVCIKTRVKMSDWLDSLPLEAPVAPLTAGVILSPLLRDSGQNPAVDIISKGLSGSDVADWHQQELGLPTTHANTGITISHIQSALAIPVPAMPLHKRVWGMDQGTNEHWLVVVDFRLPENHEQLSDIQIYEQSHRNVIVAQAVSAYSLDDCISSCDGGCLDNEPGRKYAASIINSYENVFAFDQRGGRELGGLIAKVGKVEFGGDPLAVMLCDTHRLQDMILDAMMADRYTLPAFVDPTDTTDNSLTRHLTTSNRNPETGKWTRPTDHKDDLLKALMGCELWYYLDVMGRSSLGGVNFGDLQL